MLTLEELETWDDARLHKAAEEYGMTNPASAGRQDVIFHIIDNQAISTAKEVVNSTRKRKGKQAATEETAGADTQPKKRGRKPKAKAPDEAKEENGSAPKEEPIEKNTTDVTAADAAPAPKKRGRKSKAELAAIRAQQETETQAGGNQAEDETTAKETASAEAETTAETNQPKKRGRKPGTKKNTKQEVQTAKTDNQENIPAVTDNKGITPASSPEPETPTVKSENDNT
ncbi:MAG: hypothetical protein K2O47_01005, partial [Muribaculaceae bacterium]|nr:hypothetical protein [Muribaculaceae bacterium]